MTRFGQHCSGSVCASRGVGWRPARVAYLLLAVALTNGPSMAHAQLGAVERLLGRVSDLSFYFGSGGLYPRTDNVRGDSFDLSLFGVELLIQVGNVRKPLPGATTPPDTQALVWKEMRVVRNGETSDTTYVYEVHPVRRAPPMRTLWIFELGIGYGQLVGFRARNSTIDLRGAVRDLPAVSLYATYEPVNAYVGLRSGFMKLQGLQVFDASGNAFAGRGEAFLAGLILGKAVGVLGLNLLFEASYAVRYFPSLEWSGGTLPPNTPRDLTLSGWSLGTGIQFAVGG